MARRAVTLNAEPLEDRLAPAAAGSLDPTFGTGGIVSLPRQQVGGTAALSDGKFLAIVSQTVNPYSVSLERFNANGTLDTTFGTGGSAAIPATVPHTNLVALPNGGALVAGSGIDGTNTDVRIVRYTPAGAIDPTFGTAGTALVVLPQATGKGVSAVGVESDGSVLLAGSQPLSSTGNGSTTDQMLVIRLTPTGQVDTTFGQGGTVLVPFPVGQFNSADATAVAAQPDGRIIVAGDAVVAQNTVGSPPSVVNELAPVAVRLTSTGQLDPTFGSGGRVLVTLPQQQQSPSVNRVQAVSVLANGEVLLAGQLNTNAGPIGEAISGLAVRLTATGQLDPKFGSGGLATTPTYEIIEYVSASFTAAIDPFDRVVFSFIYVFKGAVWDGATVYRLTAAGVPDAQFGTSGQVALSALPGVGANSYLAVGDVQPNGNILVAGNPGDFITGLLIQLIGNTPPAGFVPAATGTITVGGATNGTFQTLSPTNGSYGATGTITAFPGSTANVRVTTADVNGDGVPDYIVGSGPGSRPEVTVYDGKTGLTLAQFLAFESAFTGGVFVAAADLEGTGKADIIVTPDQGGGPRVVVFSIAPGGAATLRASFFGINDPSFRGGARVAAGDLNGDGTPDLAVAAGFLGGPRVALWNGKTVLSGNPTKLINDFFAFPGADATTLRNGVYVAIGNLTGTGTDLIFGGGPGGAPRVFVLGGQQVAAGNVAGAQASPVANFFVAGNSTARGGVRVAATSGGGAADLVVGSGAGAPARVRVYTGGFGTPAEPSSFQDMSVFGGATLADGVYVG
ncbi:MAG: hypothetical protein JWO38_6576 [Gemmataceae bacterium]|nr:hypothetical protein [Gemmataceae bacterium]